MIVLNIIPCDHGQVKVVEESEVKNTMLNNNKNMLGRRGWGSAIGSVPATKNVILIGVVVVMTLLISIAGTKDIRDVMTFLLLILFISLHN